MTYYGKFQKTQRIAETEIDRALAEYLASDDHLEAAAEMASDRAARYDQEAFDEMVRDDMMGRS